MLDSAIANKRGFGFGGFWNRFEVVFIEAPVATVFIFSRLRGNPFTLLSF